MMLWEISKQTLRDIRQHKARSVLAMFGIIWGTVSVVMLLALGEGFYLANMKNMMTFAENALIVIPGSTSKPYRGFPINQRIQFRAEEVMALKSALPVIHFISPVLQQADTVSYQQQRTITSISGVASDYSQLAKNYPAPGGRFISALDIKYASNIIFLGTDVAHKLFSNNNPVGKVVLLKNIPFTVIGILKESPNRGEWYNNIVMVPYTTAIKLWGDTPVNYFMAAPSDTAHTPQLKRDVIHYLSYRYHFDPADNKAIRIIDLSESAEFLHWFFRSIEIFLGFCGVLTLMVGGISVINMMYLIITERTAEIGLRMALGARYKDILLQFMLETVFLMVTGSLIGMVLSVTGIGILQHITLPAWIGTPQLSFSVFFAAALILILLGSIAAYLPARRAATLRPVEALAF